MHSESRGADRGGAQGSGTDQEVVRVEPPKTVPLSENHRVADFRCEKNPRIARFFADDWPELQRFNYCRVFLFPNPEDANQIFGFYTLSPSSFPRSQASTQEQKRIPRGISMPAILLGYMGRDDQAPKGLGEALIVDAARRAYRNSDIPSFGIMLNSDGGPKNKRLWEWYQTQGLIPAKIDPQKDDPNFGAMYAPYKRLIPELGAAKPYAIAPIKPTK